MANKWEEAPKIDVPAWQRAPVARPPESRMLPAFASGMSRGILGTADIVPRGIVGGINTLLGTQMQAPSLQRALSPVQVGTYQPRTPDEEAAALGGEILGASVLPGGGMAAAAGPRAARVLGTEAAAATGAATGGVAGEQMYGTPGQVAGTLMGGFTPTLAPMAARQFVSPLGQRQMSSRLDAAARQGVDIGAGEAAGGSLLQKGSASLPGGQFVAGRRAEQQAEQLSRRVDELAAQLTPVEVSSERAGRAIQGGIDDWADRFRRDSNRLYELVEQHLPPDQPITLARTKAIADATIENEQISKIVEPAMLRRLSDALEESSEVSLQDARRLRTAIGERLTTPALQADASTGQLKRLYAAISDDLNNAAQMAGPEAERVFNMANRYYKAGMQRIEDFLQPIRNRDLPEQAYRAVMAGTNEGASRLRAIKKSLEPEQWNVVVANVLRKLGRTRPSDRTTGAITEEATDFSPETFLTNLERLDDKARRALFSGSRYGRLEQNMNDLMQVSQGIRGLRQSAFNPSGTVGGVYNALPLAAGFVNPALLPQIGAAVGGNAALQGVLQSPGTARWLANPTQFTPALLPQMTRMSPAINGQR